MAGRLTHQLTLYVHPDAGLVVMCKVRGAGCWVHRSTKRVFASIIINSPANTLSAGVLYAAKYAGLVSDLLQIKYVWILPTLEVEISAVIAEGLRLQERLGGGTAPDRINTNTIKTTNQQEGQTCSKL